MNQFVFAAAQGAAQSRPRSRRATRACRCLGLDGLYPFLLVAGGLATALCSYCGGVAAVCGAHGCGLHVRVSMRLGCALVVVWALVFAAASGARFSLGWTTLPLLLFETFYRIGSTIFGGEQVVLPMLLTQVVVPRSVSETAFYAGMALTESLPDPLNFCRYLSTAAGGARRARRARRGRHALSRRRRRAGAHDRGGAELAHVPLHGAGRNSAPAGPRPRPLLLPVPAPPRTANRHAPNATPP